MGRLGLINLVIEHIENLNLLIHHAAQAMKSGSRLLITEYHPDRVKHGDGAEFENGDDSLTEIINFWHPLAHYEEAAKIAGLQIERVQTWGKALDEEGLPVETAVSPLLISIQFVKK